ncbi:hypothetical protein [Pantoea agglomerans]|uniref:hypothetical protein n=1 Tax=Enterobacter agglomerans TaxID=549 RepID=UPI00289AEEFD|nr:hypothetical protein [Pantoea agglomerans]WNK55802.1 hypothetical protein RM154_20040 [Pantoea agglomerans]
MSEAVKRSSKNAGDAGEYYVAYMLSRLGISAALTTSEKEQSTLLLLSMAPKALAFR